jgi:hypothetical protein
MLFEIVFQTIFHENLTVLFLKKIIFLYFCIVLIIGVNFFKKNIILIYFRAKNTLKNNYYHNFNHQIHITPPSYQIYMIPCSAFNLFYIWNVMRGNRISYKNLVRAKIYIIPRPSIQETSIVCQPQNHNHISSLGNVVIATFTSI